MTLDTEGFVASGRVSLDRRDIRALRERKGLSVGAMAKLLGVSPATLEAWESGRRNAALDTEKISQLEGKIPNSGRRIDAIDNSSVKLLRQISGLSVARIAKAFECSADSWNSYEQGRRNVPKKIQNEIADKYSDLLMQVKKLRHSLQ